MNTNTNTNTSPQSKKSKSPKSHKSGQNSSMDYNSSVSLRSKAESQMSKTSSPKKENMYVLFYLDANNNMDTDVQVVRGDMTIRKALLGYLNDNDGENHLRHVYKGDFEEASLTKLIGLGLQMGQIMFDQHKDFDDWVLVYVLQISGEGLRSKAYEWPSS